MYCSRIKFEFRLTVAARRWRPKFRPSTLTDSSHAKRVGPLQAVAMPLASHRSIWRLHRLADISSLFPSIRVPVHGVPFVPQRRSCSHLVHYQRGRGRAGGRAMPLDGKYVEKTDEHFRGQFTTVVYDHGKRFRTATAVDRHRGYVRQRPQRRRHVQRRVSADAYQPSCRRRSDYRLLDRGNRLRSHLYRGRLFHGRISGVLQKKKRKSHTYVDYVFYISSDPGVKT